jgi:hypothetical protein
MTRELAAGAVVAAGNSAAVVVVVPPSGEEDRAQAAVPAGVRIGMQRADHLAVVAAVVVGEPVENFAAVVVVLPSVVGKLAAVDPVEVERHACPD